MRNIFYSLTGIMLLLGITACSEEERYATSVVKEIQLFLDDEPWAVNTGASNKPLFIYTADCLLYTSWLLLNMSILINYHFGKTICIHQMIGICHDEGLQIFS